MIKESIGNRMYCLASFDFAAIQRIVTPDGARYGNKEFRVIILKKRRGGTDTKKCTISKSSLHGIGIIFFFTI